MTVKMEGITDNDQFEMEIQTCDYRKKNTIKSISGCEPRMRKKTYSN